MKAFCLEQEMIEELPADFRTYGSLRTLVCFRNLNFVPRIEFYLHDTFFFIIQLLYGYLMYLPDAYRIHFFSSIGQNQSFNPISQNCGGLLTKHNLV